MIVFTRVSRFIFLSAQNDFYWQMQQNWSRCTALTRIIYLLYETLSCLVKESRWTCWKTPAVIAEFWKRQKKCASEENIEGNRFDKEWNQKEHNDLNPFDSVWTSFLESNAVCVSAQTHWLYLLGCDSLEGNSCEAQGDRVSPRIWSLMIAACACAN